MDKLSQWAENSSAFAQVKAVAGEITSSNVNKAMFVAFAVLLVVQIREYMVGFLNRFFFVCYMLLI